MTVRSLVLLLPLTALWGLLPLPPPLIMIGIALTMFFFIKLHSLLIYTRIDQVHLNQLHPIETMAWMFGWAGLNPSHFFHSPKSQAKPLRRQPLDRSATVHALLKILIGAALLCGVAPRFQDTWPLLAGWIGISGIALFLHCGLIHLSALIWNTTGRPVVPIMNAPLFASSVSEFWSKRWNLAFRDYAHVAVFSPLVRRLGGAGAVFAGFVFSGIIHDLAISVPARGGYGRPSLYFILQAVAVLLERKLQKSGVDLEGRWRGRIWTTAWVVGPILLLFHRPFILNVILPIIKAINGFLYQLLVI